MERLKTYFLLTALTLLFIFVGGMLAGKNGMVIAFIVAAGMNFYAYYFSDKQVLAHYHAHPVDRHSAPGLYRIVDRLTQKAGLPMPALYILPDEQPNAFATGRDYRHAAVAVTKGLLDLLSEEEVEAVIAHELSHVKHYDMLIGTVAATIAGAIAMLAQFGMLFGGGDDRDRPNLIVTLALMFLAPMAASIIQMTVSRRREFMADAGSARITGHPEWLQSALQKLDRYAHGMAIPEAEPQTAHMFIINPLTGKDLSMRQLFSTHPTTEQRIERLEALKHRAEYRT